MKRSGVEWSGVEWSGVEWSGEEGNETVELMKNHDKEWSGEK